MREQMQPQNESNLNHSLINSAAALVIVISAGWLLYVGRSLLLPFIIAIMVWYMIFTFEKLIERIRIKNFRLPRWCSVLIAIAVIGVSLNLLANLLVSSLVDFARDAPIYQSRIEQILTNLMAALPIEQNSNIRDLLPNNLFTQFATGLTSAITTILGSTSLIIIYVLFLLLEQGTFRNKLANSIPEENKTNYFLMRDQIAMRINHYVAVKTGVSILTGLLTGVFLHFVGVPYPVIFGLIAFFLNFIPTIGSLISVILPAALALFLFDTLGPFLLVAAVLGSIQFSIGNLIEPRLLGTSLKISPLVIMLMLAFWGAIWGVTGMILCVPLTVIILVACAQFPRTRPIAVWLSDDGNVENRSKTSGGKNRNFLFRWLGSNTDKQE